MAQDTMAAGVILLLLFALLPDASAQGNFSGESISFMPIQRNKDGTLEVSLHYRENSKGSCENELSFTCESGACTSFETTAATETDKDESGQGRWCQSEGRAVATVASNQTSFTLKDSGCCWVSNDSGSENWMAHAEVDLGIRSDTHTFNRCPVTATVASLRAPQNCFSRLHLLAYDPDGDHVRCRFAENATVPSNVELDENKCIVRAKQALDTGIHVFELLLEDYSTKNITLSYANRVSAVRKAFNVSSSDNSPPFCRITLQFALEILAPIPNCVAGHVQPQFLSQTPSFGEVRHASVGNKFQLFVQAQAHHAKINDFQISGPQNMTEEFKDGKSGKAEVTLSWTPQLRDLHRVVPLCFTAETSEGQSEMRCVVIKVNKSPVAKGEATVMCSATQMTVLIKKADMPDIDKNWLKLRDPSCSLTSNDTYIMATISFTTCGTKMEDKGDFIVFTNEINSFELANSVITRRRKVNIDFCCQFPKTFSISNNFELHKSDYVFTESSFGSFSYSFEIFTDGNFSEKVAPTAYPVEVELLDMIYMGIEAESALPDVTLFVESCKATPDDNPEGSLFYYLIENGCVKDETVKVHSSDLSFKFEVQAFKFTGNFDQVYITCSVILCQSGNPASRCSLGCLNETASRRRRSLAMETANHYITQGPLKLVRRTVPGTAGDETVKKEGEEPITVNSPEANSSGGVRGALTFLSTNISTVVFASLFVITVVVLAVVIHYMSRKKRADDRGSLLVADWEN